MRSVPPREILKGLGTPWKTFFSCLEFFCEYFFLILSTFSLTSTALILVVSYKGTIVPLSEIFEVSIDPCLTEVFFYTSEKKLLH